MRLTDQTRDQAELDEILLKEPDDCPAAPPRLRKGRANSAFVMVPISWLERLATQRSGAAWAIAIRLLHLDWKSAGQPIVLGNLAVRELGIDRERKRYSLAILERLGLISVERRARQSPRITLHK
jgi:hypothetical protein